MGLSLITPPVVEPIGLQEAKDHLRVDASDEDALIDMLIAAARRRSEDWTGRQWITATYDETWDYFAAVLVPQKPPLQAVTSLKYVDDNGDTQTLGASLYTVDDSSDNAMARIVPAYGEIWPTTRCHVNGVTLRYTAGYGDGPADVPAPAKAAMLLIIGQLYKYREDIVSTPTMPLPMGAEALLNPYRVPRF